MSGPWREPAEETTELYPGLVVHDGRVTGSITLGRSRLPAWCLRVAFPEWDEYGDDGHESGAPHHGVSQEDLADFVHNLLELRGEFARLLLVLADAERRDRGGSRPAWWETVFHRKRVAAQLRRCLRALEEVP